VARIVDLAVIAEGHHADASRVLDEELGRERLVVAVNLVVLERGLEDGVQHVETGLVGGEAGSPRCHAAERTGRYLAVWVTGPGTSPVLHLDQLDRGLAHEGLDDVLVREVVRALDRVEGMILVRVLGSQSCRRSAFR
jgi:hypothetical protein